MNNWIKWFNLFAAACNAMLLTNPDAHYPALAAMFLVVNFALFIDLTVGGM
jgi:hypothetical protein